jgi:hypothetical protein
LTRAKACVDAVMFDTPGKAIRAASGAIIVAGQPVPAGHLVFTAG